MGASSPHSVRPHPGPGRKEQLGPGTPTCAWGRSLDTPAHADVCMCLECGKYTAFDGSKTLPSCETNEGASLSSKKSSKNSEEE